MTPAARIVGTTRPRTATYRPLAIAIRNVATERTIAVTPTVVGSAAQGLAWNPTQPMAPPTIAAVTSATDRARDCDPAGSQASDRAAGDNARSTIATRISNCRSGRKTLTKAATVRAGPRMSAAA